MGIPTPENYRTHFRLMKSSYFILLLFMLCLPETQQENQNVVFFQYPMLWTKYVTLSTQTYSGNNIYTYNVPVDSTNTTNVTTGVSLAGFTSQTIQSFNFRINEYIQDGIQSHITLNWTVISPSAFNYLSFTILILQNDAQYLQIIKSVYFNPLGLYSGSGTASQLIVVPQLTRQTLNAQVKIFNFITSLQSIQYKGPYVFYQTCSRIIAYGWRRYTQYYQCNPSYTWDWQIEYMLSGINDANHIWVQYIVNAWTFLYQMYSIHIIFYADQYSKQHLYPFMIDYINNFDLRSNYIPANANFRYGPNYNPKCLFGQDLLHFGRFYPSLRFEITTDGIRSASWYQQNNYIQTYTDLICVSGFECDAQFITYNNSANWTNQYNLTQNQTIVINNFYFPAYRNCSSCIQKIVGATSCQQVDYCTNCVQGFDIPNNQTCIFCLACDQYAYILDTGYCQACNNTFEGCQTCITDAYPSCTKCYNEFYLNSSLCYLCNTTMPLCVTCNTSSVCTQCYSPDDSYYLNLTTNKCTLCQSPMPHCLKCFNNSVCILCEPDFYYIDPVSQTCDPCNKTDIYCVTCSNQTFCLTCETNYNPDQNGTCQFCDFYTQNCMQCTNDTTCTNCTQQCYLNETFECAVCSELMTGCFHCDNNETCQECFEDYVLETDELCYYCALYIDECVICKNASYCTNCTYGYYVNDNHTCTKCDVPMEHCSYCLVSDTCLDCSFGFYPNVSECLLCKLQMKECIDCTTESFCTQCTIDFIPVNGTCQCREGYLVTQVCTTILGCVSNHYVSGIKRCLACNAAANFTYSNFNCSCQDGYRIFGTNEDAVCVETCGDGLLIYLECDDGNLLNGDGCSSKCKIQRNYECQNGSLWSRSICYLVTDFSVTLYSIKRDQSSNSGVVKLQISPVQPGLGNIDWASFVSFEVQGPEHYTSSSSTRLLQSVYVNVSRVTYQQGFISISFDYFESIENFHAHVDVEFDPTLFKAAGKPLSFPMKSMNAPLSYEGYLDHHFVLVVLFYVIVSLGLLQFLVCFKTKDLVGAQTLQVFQFIFFAKLLTDDINPSLPYIDYPLVYASGFNFILSDEGRNYNMQMGMARLNIQPQFVLNLNLSILILLVFYAIRIYYLITRIPKQIQVTKKNVSQVKQEKQKLKSIYQGYILPMSLISIFLLIFSIGSKYNIRNDYSSKVPDWVQCSTAITAFFLLFYVYFKEAKTIFKIHISNQDQFISKQKNETKQNYLSFNIIFYICSAIVMNSFNNSNQGILIVGVLCLFYLLSLLLEKPYKKTLHNIGVIVNLTVLISYLALLAYIKFFDDQLNIVLIWIYVIVVMLLFIVVFGYIRMYYSYKQRKKLFEGTSSKNFARTKQEAIIENQLRQKIRDQNPYLYENQLKEQSLQKTNSRQKNMAKLSFYNDLNDSGTEKDNVKIISPMKVKQVEMQVRKAQLKQSLRTKRINDRHKILQ